MIRWGEIDLVLKYRYVPPPGGFGKLALKATGRPQGEKLTPQITYSAKTPEAITIPWDPRREGRGTNGGWLEKFVSR